MGLWGYNSGRAFASAMQYIGIVSDAILAFNKYKVDSDESGLFEALADDVVRAANATGIKKPLSDAKLAMLRGHIAGIIDLFEKD